MSDRLPPTRTQLSGTPRTGRLVLARPRPEYIVTVEYAPTGARLVARSTFGGQACVVNLERVAAHLDEALVPVPEHFRGTGYIDGYEFRVHADAAMRELTLFDDLPAVLVAYGIADVGAA